jgi:rhamnogalacturonyl hydrolase YesR
VEKWVEDHDYKGYEPFDGLSSFLRPLTLGNLFLDRLLMQLVRQSPVNLRPLFGVKPLDSTIGRGYMAGGYLTMLKLTNGKKYKDKAVSCLEWLMENRSSAYADYSWGKHFDFASRGGRYPKFEPITIWTSLIGIVFLDAYDILQHKKYLEVAISVCNWILNLPRTLADSGLCINYTALGDGDCTIHNQSMMGAAMLVRTAKYTGNAEYMSLAREAMKYSCKSQLPEGGWYYGEEGKYRWIDNFHTGYNLDSLKGYIETTGDRTYEGNLRRGFEFFKRHFFEENGMPKYYHNCLYPVDSQCASQAIETLANFAEYDQSSLKLGLKVAKWTIDNMQDREGYFYYRELPWMKVKIPMLHWGQATMYKALSSLLSRITM